MIKGDANSPQIENHGNYQELTAHDAAEIYSAYADYRGLIASKLAQSAIAGNKSSTSDQGDPPALDLPAGVLMTNDVFAPKGSVGKSFGSAQFPHTV